MKNRGKHWLGVAAMALIASGTALATTTSYTGTLETPENYFQTTVTLTSTGTLGLQTYGFGGGMNAAGSSIAAGGFDPLVAVFDGADAHSLEAVTADTLSNYSSFQGCGPAGFVTVGSVPGNCGDITMNLSLAAGTYTIILSDALYIPNAAFDNGALAEGFTDLTGAASQTCGGTDDCTTDPTAPAFQTCVDATDCNTDTGNWALDVTTSGPGGGTATPEPFMLLPTGLALILAGSAFRFRRSRNLTNSKGKF